MFDERGRCRVRTLTAGDFEEIYDVRLLLERESFRLAATRHTAEQLSAMRRNIARMRGARSIVRLTMLDIEFHDLIVEAAAHTRVAHLWAIMKGQIQIFTASLQRQLLEIADDVRDSQRCGPSRVPGNHRLGIRRVPADAAQQHLETWRDWLLVNRVEKTADTLSASTSTPSNSQLAMWIRRIARVPVCCAPLSVRLPTIRRHSDDSSRSVCVRSWPSAVNRVIPPPKERRTAAWLWIRKRVGKRGRVGPR